MDSQSLTTLLVLRQTQLDQLREEQQAQRKPRKPLSKSTSLPEKMGTMRRQQTAKFGNTSAQPASRRWTSRMGSRGLRSDMGQVSGVEEGVEEAEEVVEKAMKGGGGADRLLRGGAAAAREGESDASNKARETPGSSGKPSVAATCAPMASDEEQQGGAVSTLASMQKAEALLHGTAAGLRHEANSFLMEAVSLGDGVAEPPGSDPLSGDSDAEVATAGTRARAGTDAHAGATAAPGGRAAPGDSLEVGGWISGLPMLQAELGADNPSADEEVEYRALQSPLQLRAAVAASSSPRLWARAISTQPEEEARSAAPDPAPPALPTLAQHIHPWHDDDAPADRAAKGLSDALGTPSSSSRLPPRDMLTVYTSPVFEPDGGLGEAKHALRAQLATSSWQGNGNGHNGVSDLISSPFREVPLQGLGGGAGGIAGGLGDSSSPPSVHSEDFGGGETRGHELGSPRKSPLIKPLDTAAAAVTAATARPLSPKRTFLEEWRARVLGADVLPPGGSAASTSTNGSGPAATAAAGTMAPTSTRGAAMSNTTDLICGVSPAIAADSTQTDPGGLVDTQPRVTGMVTAAQVFMPASGSLQHLPLQVQHLSTAAAASSPSRPELQPVSSPGDVPDPAALRPDNDSQHQLQQRQSAANTAGTSESWRSGPGSAFGGSGSASVLRDGPSRLLQLAPGAAPSSLQAAGRTYSDAKSQPIYGQDNSSSRSSHGSLTTASMQARQLGRDGLGDLGSRSHGHHHSAPGSQSGRGLDLFTAITDAGLEAVLEGTSPGRGAAQSCSASLCSEGDCSSSHAACSSDEDESIESGHPENGGSALLEGLRVGSSLMHNEVDKSPSADPAATASATATGGLGAAPPSVGGGTDGSGARAQQGMPGSYAYGSEGAPSGGNQRKSHHHSHKHSSSHSQWCALRHAQLPLSLGMPCDKGSCPAAQLLVRHLLCPASPAPARPAELSRLWRAGASVTSDAAAPCHVVCCASGPSSSSKWCSARLPSLSFWIPRRWRSSRTCTSPSTSCQMCAWANPATLVAQKQGNWAIAGCWLMSQLQACVT